MPEELAQQMPVIKELLGDLGIKIVQCEGYEADDILRKGIRELSL